MTKATMQSAQQMRAASTCLSGLGRGTEIWTTDGILPIEFLEPGDRIVTFDLGAVPVSRISSYRVPASRIVQVLPEALVPRRPGTRLALSSRQPLMLRDWRARAMFGKRMAFVEAGRLVDGEFIRRAPDAEPTLLFQLEFDDCQHVLPLADGALHVTSAPLPAHV